MISGSLALKYGVLFIKEVKPHWYIGWLIYFLRLDLYHEIPIGKIKSVEQVGKWFGYGKIEVSFISNDLETRKILLYIKQHEQFIIQVKELI